MLGAVGGIAILLGSILVFFWLGWLRRAVDVPVISAKYWIEVGPQVAGICMARDASTIYAALWEDRDESPLQVVHVATGKTLGTTPFGDLHPHGDVVLSADETYLYTTTYYQPSISRLDLRQGNARTDLRITNNDSSWAISIGITPNKERLVVGVGQDGRSVSSPKDSLAVVDVANDKFELLADIPFDQDIVEHAIGFSADSRFAYVVTRGMSTLAPKLCEVSLTSPFHVTRTLECPGSDLWGAAICPELNRDFVADAGLRKVWSVNLKTFSLEFGLSLEQCAPRSVALNHQGTMLAVLCAKSNSLFRVTWTGR